MSDVAVVDYGMCNLDSVARAVEECGCRPVVTDQPRDLARASRIILPGVGAFPLAMRNLRERGLDAALAEQVLGAGLPFLGICLGMQLLATTGWEVEETPGLGWIPGEVKRLQPTAHDRRIPHVGWDELGLVAESALFAGVRPDQDFYFVHSYHLACSDEEHVLARTPYCGGFVSALARGNVFGVQFHPEKSQRAGFRVLRNFLAL